MSTPTQSAPTVESEIDRYTGLYRDQKCGWHRQDVNPTLVRYSDLFPKNVTGEPVKSILVPLCGKTRDIPYLLSLGYHVFGIEAVEQAIIELGEEHHLGLEYREEEGVYATGERNLIVFLGDIFKCPIEKWGPFDGVWDRGSLSVFPEHIRQDYISVIRRGLNHSPGFSYLLEVYDYDKSVSKTPPRACSSEDIKSLYESWCKVELLHSEPASPKFLQHFAPLREIQCNHVAYLLRDLK